MSAKNGVYVVSKIRHVEMWRQLRAEGLPIISSWIDEGVLGEVELAGAWPRYLAEASSAAVVLVFQQTTDEYHDMLKGGVLEIGAGLAAGAYVIVVGHVPELGTTIYHDNLIEVDNIYDAAHLAKEYIRLAKSDRTYQQLLAAWVIRCFGSASFQSAHERSRRVLEEAIEFAQASGVSEEECAFLLHYVYSRPIGEIAQELGGLITTLLAAAESHGLDLDLIMKNEVERVLSLPVEYFKERLARKVAAGVALAPVE